MEYYELILEETKQLYKQAEDKNQFIKNADKTKQFIEEYKKFPAHNPLLVGAVERFVLN